MSDNYLNKIIEEEEEENNGNSFLFRKTKDSQTNNWWKIRAFMKNPVIWEWQIHTLAVSPQEEQEELLAFMKENTQNIINNGLYTHPISWLSDISSEEIEEKLNIERLKVKKKTPRKKSSNELSYKRRMLKYKPITAYDMERSLDYGINKYGKKIVRNRDKGIR
tara:strand:+ start:3868 stop:4359 length:492 start_codon:yes stop_codon:yes gene_type:complete